jgi:hypothetical protein
MSYGKSEGEEMNRMPELAVVVLDIAGTCAKVKVEGSEKISALTKLGFMSKNGEYERPISSMEDREALVKNLIALGSLFSGGRDWSPADVVDYFRAQGRVSTGYRKIEWADPYTYFILEV